MSNDISCPICASGSRQLFRGLEDRIYQVAYRADLYACSSLSCRHVFIYPEPSEQEIAGFYKTYSTHSIPESRQGILIRAYEFLCNALGSIDRYAAQKRDLALAGLANARPGRILDVGCGSGAVLSRLAARGWTDCHGIDFDENAVRIARSRGLDRVKVGSLKAISAGAERYDYILLNHVIEHLPRPEIDLQLAKSLLKPDGKIIIRTPNNRSLLARLMKASWRGWEPPRHLNIFSSASLELLAKKVGLKAARSYTSNGMLQGIFIESVKIASVDKGSSGAKWLRLAARLVFPLAVLLVSIGHRLDRRSGEELVMVLEKA